MNHRASKTVGRWHAGLGQRIYTHRDGIVFWGYVAFAAATLALSESDTVAARLSIARWAVPYEGAVAGAAATFYATARLAALSSPPSLSSWRADAVAPDCPPDDATDVALEHLRIYLATVRP